MDAGQEKEKEAEKEHNRVRTGMIIVLVVVFLAIAYAIMQGGSIAIDFILIMSGITLGVFAAYILYHNLSNERVLEFDENEEVLIETRDKGNTFIQILDDIGDFIGKESPINVNMYLTNRGILAEPPGTGQAVFFAPFYSIRSFNLERKFLSKYIRLNYVDINGEVAEALLFIGDDTDKWVEKLNEISNQRQQRF